MIRIEFVPYEELTSEDWDRIIDFINMYGDEVKMSEEYEEAYDIETQEREDNMEYVFVKENLFAPTQTYKMPICKCKKVTDVETITERDDFLYEKCMTCGKMIEGSARPWTDEDL